jgi:hypothetical protein
MIVTFRNQYILSTHTEISHLHLWLTEISSACVHGFLFLGISYEKCVCQIYKIKRDTVERLIPPRFKATVKSYKPNYYYVAYITWYEKNRTEIIDSKGAIDKAVRYFINLTNKKMNFRQFWCHAISLLLRLAAFL